MTASGVDEDIVISVIIPAYDEEEYIDSCVTSVLDQHCSQKYEVLVCDDNSSDRTHEILKAIKTDQDGLQIFRNSKNRGIISTVNLLTEAASGDFLLRIDADSVLIPGTIQAMYNAFASGTKLVFGRVEVKNTRYLHPTAASIGKQRGRGTWYGGACIGIDRKEFVATGGFKENMIGAEVQELKQRARTHNWTVARLDKHGVESNFPVKLLPVLRRKLDAGRTHINQYTEEPESFSIWELRGPIFWTILSITAIGSIFIPSMLIISIMLLLLPTYQYSKDASLAVSISGRTSFVLLYPSYQILSALLRTIGVWSSIDNVFHILRQKYSL